jgi:predicted O-methyltransferase YrrM
MIIISGNYTNYTLDVPALFSLLKKGGLLIYTNIFDGNKLQNPVLRDDSTVAKRELVEFLKKSEDFYSVISPSQDGLLLVKRV